MAVVHNPVPVQVVACGGCKVWLMYELDEIFETFEGTGPYEVECPRNVVKCCQCGVLVDVKEPARK